MTRTTNRDTEDADDREARKRGRYLARRHGLRNDIAIALAYRELGYSHSGIAKKVDHTEATVADWMDQIADEYGPRAIETKQPEERTGGLNR